MSNLIKKLQPYTDKNFTGNLKARFSNHYVRLVTSDIIVTSQLISLTTTIIACAIVLAIIFESLLLGIIISLPTIIAVLLNFLVMSIFRVPLNIGTSIIASIGIGVGIDYAIHYFQRFKYLYFEYSDYGKAIGQAIQESARAILSNASAVGFGFAVLMISTFKVFFNLGWIISLSMFTTALNALIILPALLFIIKPKVKKKSFFMSL